VPGPPNLNDAINQANAEVANATAAVNSIIGSIEQLLKDCEKIQGKCARAVLKAPAEIRLPGEDFREARQGSAPRRSTRRRASAREG
jgi:hypothetical protein